jgi:ferredoxin
VSKSVIAASVALLLAVGLVVTLGLASLLTGAFHFLFMRPRLSILLAKNRETGFAFGFKWNSSQEPARFDRVKLRLFNPFGSPTQVEVTRDFQGQGSTFGQEVDFGPGMRNFWEAQGLENARVQVELSSTRDGVCHQFEMNGAKFKEKFFAASQTAESYHEAHKVERVKPLYHTVERTFIAEPLGASNKVLKLSTNPEFASEFAAKAPETGADTGADNFSVSKVWIDPGCIVCDACAGIYPEVFDVQAETCVIKPDAPLNNGLLIEEAAEACPVEVIKFTKAS